jgi:hypothetical protein
VVDVSDGEGSVNCSPVRRNYCYCRFDDEPLRVTPRLNARDFGPGSIVVFSLYNHGGAGWDAAHFPPSLADLEEFGVAPLHKRECDEWVRVNMEQPIAVSMDAPPCAWPTFSAYLAEVNRSFREYREDDDFIYMLKPEERLALWAERWKVSEEEAKRRLDEL